MNIRKKIKFGRKILAIFVLIFLFFNIAKTKADECKDSCVTNNPDNLELQNKCKDVCKENAKKIENALEEKETYEKMIQLKTKSIINISGQIEYIDQQQVKNQKNLQETTTQIKTLEEKISDLKKNIEEKEKSINYQRKMLSGLMQSYYDYDQQGILELVLFENSMSESLNQSDYIEQSGTKVSEILEEIKNTQKELIKDKDELNGDYEKTEKLKEKLQVEKSNLQSSENQKQTLLTKTQTEKEKYEKLLSDIEDEIYSLESNKSVDYSNVPAAKGGYLDYPVSIVKITQGYGMTSFAKKGAYGGKPHNGIDFGIKSGEVFAVKSGTVIGVGNNGKYAYGKWVAIDHGDGLVTLYGHFSSQSVSKGQKVKMGQKIGTSGNTGFSTGPHLHFSVFDKKSFGTVESKYVKGLMIPTGASINPMKYLK